VAPSLKKSEVNPQGRLFRGQGFTTGSTYTTCSNIITSRINYAAYSTLRLQSILLRVWYRNIIFASFRTAWLLYKCKQYTVWDNLSVTKNVLLLGCLRNSVFFTSVHSVCYTELPKIPRNYTEFRVTECCWIPLNSVMFLSLRNYARFLATSIFSYF
jgi:hypothetical protein